MSDNEPIRYSLEDGIATITIDRPARKNALSVEAMNGLTNAWERVERDSQARVVILTSADCGVFSAGLDLRQAAEIRARDGVDILTLMRDPMQTAMRTVSKPIIAAIPLLWMLPQPVVMELVLTGETLPIERLAEYGFVNYLEETPDAVRARALQLARKIVEGAPLSVRAAKASVLAAMDLGCEKGLVEANRLHVEAYASLDAIEGPRAFAEKRKPVWQGK